MLVRRPAVQVAPAAPARPVALLDGRQQQAGQRQRRAARGGGGRKEPQHV